MSFITEIPRELLQNKEFPRGGANLLFGQISPKTA